MSTDKTRAELLADALERPGYDAQKERDTTASAAELRRLSASEAALLEALEAMVECSHTMNICVCANASQLARAAIDQAKEARHG